MKIVKQSYKILDRRNLSVEEKIEQAARLSHKSEDKIKDNESAKDFVMRLAKQKHFPVMEFANFHIKISCSDLITTEYFTNIMGTIIGELFPGKYTPVSFEIDRKAIYISGTVRALMDLVMFKNSRIDLPIHRIATLLREEFLKGNFPFELTDIPEVSEFHSFNIKYEMISASQLRVECSEYEKHLMCAVHFITNRAVTHELVRHRPSSFMQESQRYCRYSEGKFGNEVTFILPDAFFKEMLNIDDPHDPINIWHHQMMMAEGAYFELLKTCTPQAARTVLPNSCKTEIIVYATIEEWNHIFDMRISPAAEPSMRQIMIPLYNEFFLEINKDFWE